MHELLMKVAGMRLKCDFSAKVFVLKSITVTPRAVKALSGIT